MKSFVIFVITFCCLLNYSFAQKTGSITGTVIDKATQEVLPFVNIALQGTTKGTTTDENGKFRITEIPVKTYNVTASFVGYKPITLFNIVVNVGNEISFQIELEAETNTLAEVSVTSKKSTSYTTSLETPLSIQKLTAEEIKASPGGNFDISKVIQILPGVGGGVGGGNFRNDIIIRGGGSNENVFYLDGIEVPVINHFQTQGSSGGPQGMLNVSFIEDVKLSSSAFDARYDNALSSVFQFKQKNGNPDNLQGNVRFSASELATTFEGPINKKTTFLASARRSYLQLLFKAIDLPIRPNYWDFQTKINHQINKKTTLTFMGLGAIDEFSFAALDNYTPEKAAIVNSAPSVNQWNYTVGVSLKRLVKNGYWNLALSRNMLDNTIEKYEDNNDKINSLKNLDLNSQEAENKLRYDMNKTLNGWKLAYGAMAQLVRYTNNTTNIFRKKIVDANGNVIQPEIGFKFVSPLDPFYKFGAFIQVGKRLFDNKLGISSGLRTDVNTFTENGMNVAKTLSPRLSLSYYINDKWSVNTSVGRYSKLPPYTILGFANNFNVLVNKNAKYQISNHLAGGLEYLPNESFRFTLEGFYKKYNNMPVSKISGISLANLGADYNVLGNEEVLFNGKGKTYGAEFFAQKKLTERFFGVFSYTYYRSLFSGVDKILKPSSWDNRHLVSFAWGYKFRRNWELGIKFRFQGGAPYSPVDEVASQRNYATTGITSFDFSRLNTRRLANFNSSDVRIDKKFNFKKTAFDLYLDVTNWYVAVSPILPEFTLKRSAETKDFVTTDGKPLKQDGSNGIPIINTKGDALTTPSIGFIWEF
jgi:CarboxypepD_reg-like domain/TonB-dependent Receptor Plug Domain